MEIDVHWYMVNQGRLHKQKEVLNGEFGMTKRTIDLLHTAGRESRNKEQTKLATTGGRVERMVVEEYERQSGY